MVRPDHTALDGVSALLVVPAVAVSTADLSEAVKQALNSRFVIGLS
jgi:hypothetical protein